MRPFTDQQYEAVPKEEKVEEVPVLTKKSHKWGKILVFVLIAFLALSALVAITSNHQTTDRNSVSSTEYDVATDQIAQDDAEAFLSRATGQQYLLGVGKADITGFVSAMFCYPQ